MFYIKQQGTPGTNRGQTLGSVLVFHTFGQQAGGTRPQSLPQILLNVKPHGECYAEKGRVPARGRYHLIK